MLITDVPGGAGVNCGGKQLAFPKPLTVRVGGTATGSCLVTQDREVTRETYEQDMNVMDGNMIGERHKVALRLTRAT